MTNSNEKQKIIDMQRANMKRKNKRIDWIKYDDSGKAKGISPARLGEFICNKHKEDWLLVQNEDKNEFWVYKSKTHSEPNGASVSQKVWQLSEIKNTRAEVHALLKKHKLWSAKAEKDTYTYITGELLNSLKLKSDTIDSINQNAILAADGVLCFDNEGNIHVEDNNPKYYFTDFAPYKIENCTNEKAPLTDKWFAETFGKGALTLKQYIGYMFYPTYKTFQAYIILVAAGGDGKSTTINFINSLLPPNQVSHITLQNLTASEKQSKNFGINRLENKRLNTRNDITGDFIQDPSMIKTLTGNDPIYASVKYKDDADFTNFAKFIFACNSLPDFRDTSVGFKRRAYILTAHKIDKFQANYDMNKIKAERGAFVVECIKAYIKQIEDQRKNSQEGYWQLYRDRNTIHNSAEWSLDNDQVQQFLNEKAYPKEDTKTTDVRSMEHTYNAYMTWTKEAGVKPLSNRKFNRQMRDKGYRTTRTTLKNRRSVQYWVGLKLYSDSESLPFDARN